MNRIIQRHILISSLVAFPLFVYASIEEAVDLISTGKLDEASLLLSESKEPARFLYQGRIAFLNYNFTEAGKLYSQYRKAIGRSTPLPEAEVYNRQLRLANNSLESVAEIEVIDSITVPTSSFLSYFRLPQSAGRLAEANEIPIKGREEIASSVFFNERGDFAMWAEPDTLGIYRIAESSRLIDGTWSEVHLAPEILNNNGDADYPFMCADGSTLYFASEGEDSMGGFDLFVASRDPSDGTYMKPRNLGMPFNSPFDDMMMAIDEENGVGWWATDRNRLEDKLTIYVYRLEDSRSNIDPEDEDLISLARLSDISMTQDPDTDYSAILRPLSNVRTGRPAKQKDFQFYMPGRGVLTSWSDLRTTEGRRLIREYLGADKKLSDAEQQLRDLRRRYRDAVGSAARKALSSEILRLETLTMSLKNDVKGLRNRLIEAESL